MRVTLKWIETVLILIVVIRIDAQAPTTANKEDKTLWYPNQALDVWSGKKSLMNVITNDFFGVLNGVALNPQQEWRPQKKVDAENLPALLHDRDETVRLVQLADDDEEEYDEDYEDVETYEYYNEDKNKQQNQTSKPRETIYGDY